MQLGKQFLADVSSIFRQHLWDRLDNKSQVATHCINHSLGYINVPTCSHKVVKNWPLKKDISIYQLNKRYNYHLMIIQTKKLYNGPRGGRS